MLAYKSERVLACCSLQAEAIALQQGVDYAISIGMSECSFITDNFTLAEACSILNPLMEVDWRAHKEILDIWRKWDATRGLSVHMKAGSIILWPIVSQSGAGLWGFPFWDSPFQCSLQCQAYQYLGQHFQRIAQSSLWATQLLVVFQRIAQLWHFRHVMWNMCWCRHVCVMQFDWGYLKMRLLKLIWIWIVSRQHSWKRNPASWKK